LINGNPDLGKTDGTRRRMPFPAQFVAANGRGASQLRTSLDMAAVRDRGYQHHRVETDFFACNSFCSERLVRIWQGVCSLKHLQNNKDKI
jgi:hypothetical protein